MKTLILCGGIGTRLTSLISDRPKPLAPVGGKPFIDYVLKWLYRYGFTEIIFSLSYKADQIQKYVADGKRFGIKTSYVVEPILLGTGGAIQLALKKDKSISSLLVINGDTFFDINLDALLKFNFEKKGAATIALSNVLDVARFGEVKTNQNDKIIKFIEKPSITSEVTRAGLVSGGVYLLNQRAINELLKFKTPFSIEKDYFQKVVGDLDLFGYIADITHYDIGTPSGYRKTEKYLSGGDDIVIRSRAPLRVSFSGGGTDVPPFDSQEGGSVLNATINRYVYGLLRLREDRKVRMVSADYRKSVLYDDVKNLNFDGHLDLIKAVIKRLDINYGFEIEIRSDVPPNSGMGSSASVCTAVIGLFNHLSVERKLTKPQIAELAFSVETEDLGIPGGRQDQYATVFGGFNFLEFNGGDFVKVSPIDLDQSVLCELEKNVVIVYIGSRDISGNQHKKSQENQKSRLKYLQNMKQLSYESYSSLLRKDLNRFGMLLEETWKLKKMAFPGSSTSRIERLYKAAKNSGAIGGRVAGAGGGGHMIFYCYPGTEHEVTNKLQSMGTRVLDFSFDFKGLKTWEI